MARKLIQGMPAKCSCLYAGTECSATGIGSVVHRGHVNAREDVFACSNSAKEKEAGTTALHYKQRRCFSCCDRQQAVYRRSCSNYKCSESASKLVSSTFSNSAVPRMQARPHYKKRATGNREYAESFVRIQFNTRLERTDRHPSGIGKPPPP